MASCRLIAPGAQEVVILPQHCWLPPLRKKPMHQEVGTKLRRLWLRVLLLAPYFMLVISCIQISVALVGSVHGDAQRWMQEALVFDPQRRQEVWRFLSYVLLHQGAAHAALNIVIQLVLAVPLEREQKWLRTAFVYFGGGLAGSLSTSVLAPELFLVGASAGVYALLTSQLANIILNFPTLKYRLARAFAVCVLCLADVAFSLYHHFLLNNTCPRVGWAAHTGGAVVGLLVGLLVFTEPDTPLGQPATLPLGAAAPKAADRKALTAAIRCGAAASLAVLLTAAVAVNLWRPN
ncbi:rhomboid-related protein 2 isoform X2 [Neocloeon triangulifer]|nr:rhomboid-related protein 2 isoform X2 [Neocloeon triangulifer]XP_059489659.1 rhomboid-related protein 2 isoform X2 [Neocloeon triangulifer]